MVPTPDSLSTPFTRPPTPTTTTTSHFRTSLRYGQSNLIIDRYLDTTVDNTKLDVLADYIRTNTTPPASKTPVARQAGYRIWDVKAEGDVLARTYTVDGMGWDGMDDECDLLYDDDSTGSLLASGFWFSIS